ncbi:MAG: helix-turn-helix domain-containing protein [Nitrososphaeraceae archaeon]|nr:helix-turn-helix domain-containing protein [Nitrososphaeraceae archaeon]MDW0239845.1 helix-turn-helix domain-containing protein [Nitrososphaeraceae archaeon]
MTLNNKNWVKNEVLRLYLSGYSQENIAKELNISVGTVNTFVSEIIQSDDTFDLQRQIAIVSKKNGVDIRDIAANLRWKNLIKQSSLDDRKIEKFLDAMGILINKYSIKPSIAANQFYSLIETMLRDNIEPHKLKGEIKLGLDELQRIKDQIKINDELLKQSNAEFHREQERSRVKERDLNSL